MLQGIDTLVYDMQDVGVRFYTYMHDDGVRDGGGGEAQDSGGRAGPAEPDRRLADRGADRSTRPRVGFIGYIASMPMRHGMTLGELAKLFNAERKIGCELTVVAMRRWRRDRWFDETGLNGSTRRRTCGT